jgi:hypothetical protein
VWEEARRYSNVSGTDDLVHRVWVLAGMVCILGYTANASAIPLHDAPGGGVPYLLGYLHDSTPVQAAAAFFLLIKATRVLVLFLYAWWLPAFRVAQALSGVAVLIPMVAYSPLLWVTSRRAQVACAIAGIVLDLMRVDMILYNVYGRYLLVKRRKEVRRQIEGGEIDAAHAPDTSLPLFRMVMLPENIRLPGECRKDGRGWGTRVIARQVAVAKRGCLVHGERGHHRGSAQPLTSAINIEHSVDRSGAFTVLVVRLHWPDVRSTHASLASSSLTFSTLLSRESMVRAPSSAKRRLGSWWPGRSTTCEWRGCEGRGVGHREGERIHAMRGDGGASHSWPQLAGWWWRCGESTNRRPSPAARHCGAGPAASEIVNVQWGSER